MELGFETQPQPYLFKEIAISAYIYYLWEEIVQKWELIYQLLNIQLII